jgi:hypothetical protein
MLATACDEQRSVLDEGVTPGAFGKPHVVRSAEALRVSRRVTASWKRELRRRAQTAPAQRFRNLPPDVLRSRLEAAAERYSFEVVSVQLLRPRQLAPRIVVKTTHYLELARAAPELLRRLDPKASTSDDRTGWRFEGFYFEARDEHEVPFFTVDNFWRGPGPGGGQWARSDRLFPYEHG